MRTAYNLYVLIGCLTIGACAQAMEKDTSHLLRQAVENSDLAQVSNLLEQGTPLILGLLHIAVNADDIPMALRLIQAGAHVNEELGKINLNINYYVPHGIYHKCAPLDAAKTDQMILMLLEHGAYPEEFVQGDHRSDAVARVLKNSGTRGLLLQALATGDAARLSSTIEHLACLPRGNCIKNGLLDEPNSWGKTLLMVAVLSGSVERVRLLLQHHVAVQAYDNQGDTALMLARKHNYPAIIHLLENYILFYKKWLFVKRIIRRGSTVLNADVLKLIADYVFTADTL